MNWDAIGAIGNLVSGVGMIATLAYLAMQVRQNSRQLAAQSRFNFYQTRVSLGLAPISDRELMSGAIKAQSGQELDALETVKLQMLTRVLFAWEYEVGEVKHGRLAHAEFNAAEKHRMTQIPIMQMSWQRYRETAPKPYVEFMEREVIGPPKETS